MEREIAAVPSRRMICEHDEALDMGRKKSHRGVKSVTPGNQRGWGAFFALFGEARKKYRQTDTRMEGLR